MFGATKYKLFNPSDIRIVVISGSKRSALTGMMLLYMVAENCYTDESNEEKQM